MSCIYQGSVIESELSRNARGGTEMMRERLLRNVDGNLLKKFAIHLSRPRELYGDVKNVLWCHDLATDPENRILKDGGWDKFDHFVFVSYWQRDQYILIYGIPYSRCTVIPNAVEVEYESRDKNTDEIKFIYHTTPHRGLQLLYPIFDALSKEFDNISLDVYSSFAIYGWQQRDMAYQDLFQKLKTHPKIRYHGSRPNKEVLEALEQAHIFLYPSIWMETSCIAMIEAIRSSVLVIHPSYGALPETSSGATLMYEYTENHADHVIEAYTMTRNLLLSNQANSLLDRLTRSERFLLPSNSINNFTLSWNHLLSRLSA
jgi:UDP-glucose:(glucosyl)LPS alpha-1,2-glucosyltransferase